MGFWLLGPLVVIGSAQARGGLEGSSLGVADLSQALEDANHHLNG